MVDLQSLFLLVVRSQCRIDEDEFLLSQLQLRLLQLIVDESKSLLFLPVDVSEFEQVADALAIVS